MTKQKTKGGETTIPDASNSDDFSAEPALDRAVQSRIGDQLRAMYDNLMQQPIPDRLSELLGRLEQGEEPRR